MLNYDKPLDGFLVFVTKDVDNDVDNTLINDYSDLSDGQIVLVDQDNKAVHTTNDPDDAKYCRLVQRRGTMLWYSGPIRSTDKAWFRAGTSDTQQISFIGYNGVSGSMDDTAETTYTVSIKETSFKDARRQREYFAEYTSGASTNQFTITTNLEKSLEENINTKKGDALSKYIKVERVCDEAGSDTSGGAVTVTYGSTTVTIPESAGAAADAGKYNGDAATIVVGDFIRFSSATESKKDPVYRVAAITGAGTAACTITLDRPYKGASAALAANTVSVVVSATGLAAEWGIKLTGIDDNSTYRVGGRAPYVRAFDIYLTNGFVDATHTEDTAAVQGTGTYPKVIEREKYGQTGRGKYDIVGVPSTDYTDLVANTTDAPYDSLVIQSKIEHIDTFSNNVAYETIEIFMSAASTDGYSNDILLAGLEDLLGDITLKDYS